MDMKATQPSCCSPAEVLNHGDSRLILHALLSMLEETERDEP